MRNITAKLGNMRKLVDWTVYPRNDGADEVIIQSDHRIARINLTTRMAMLSKHCSGGAYFPHLAVFMGATQVPVTQDVIESLNS